LRNNTYIAVRYFDKEDDSLIKEEPIPNCHLDDIEEILLKVYPNEQHVFNDKDGKRFLPGGYDVTDEIKDMIEKRFNIKIDTKNFDCQISEEYKE
jgi:hypothetical protein